MRILRALQRPLAAAATMALLGVPASAAGHRALVASSPQPGPPVTSSPTTPGAPTPTTPTTPPVPPVITRPAKPVSKIPLVSVRHLNNSWQITGRVGNHPVSWAAQRGNVTLMRFNQQYARLELHPGAEEPGGGGWAYRDVIAGQEAHRVLAGFNSGFKFKYGSLGWMESGRSAVPLSGGLGSIVTYADGSTQIGAWRQGVPQPGKRIVSVRQNLNLLIDHGRAAEDLGCVEACWGATDEGLTYVARSGLGITGTGRLVWAAGMHLSPAELAYALVAAGAQRAVELDINPEWVAGFMYVHGGSGPRPVGMVPGQGAIGGALLRPYGRDFFTVVVK